MNMDDNDFVEFEEEQPEKGNQRTIIIVAVVAVVLLCCCALVIGSGVWLWNNGDALIQNLAT